MKLSRLISTVFCTAVIALASAVATLAIPPTPTPDLSRPNALPSDITTARRGEMPLEFFNYLKDCLLINVKDGQQQYAAWLPLRTFLKMYAAGGGDSGMLESKVGELKPYLMFMVENRSIDQYKNPISESAESLRSRARLRLPDGTEVKPVDRTPEGMPQSPPSFGALGRRGQMLIFQVGDNSTDLDLDNTPKSKLQLVLQPNETFKETVFTWHLPLELAGTPKQCTRCHNDVSGKWTHCPWCGLKQK
jgi:hypothetical protein